MPGELTMPKLSDSMADAVIIKWLKASGDDFRRGEALLEVETDKATVVYEAESDGTLEAILVPEGGTASVGQAIATLAGDGTAAPAGAPLATSDAAATVEPPAPSVAPVTNGAASTGARPNATPVARRTALELGLSLHDVAGSGPGGRITGDDVRRAAAPGTGAPTPSSPADARGEVTVVEPTPTQATIARRMAESAATIPVFTVSADADVSQIVAQRRNASGEGPSLNDFIVKAAALALRDFPRFNASWLDGRIALHSGVNVGIAVATDDALLVPVIADAASRTLAEIAAETRRLAEAARQRTLRPEELQGGTFTVSNLGMFGVRSFTAIVDPPQAAILAVGSSRREAVEAGSGGGVAFRDVMTLTLSCDHRVVYGADGARFLSRLCELLEQPLALAL
ncbi:MAG TPA: dihydrolipoamide acetyltransferase family protein [Gaiellaceae bacterium]|nr:dihydrolipoamide acetyltransferase family protein [Gaiellaceae bacterium]